MVNFCINRFWAFKSNDGYCSSTSGQLIRFFTVVLGSISLKSAGTYLLHRSLNLDYELGRLLIDSIVSYGFNYPLMKYWVFKINKLGISEAEEEEDYFETPGEEQRV